MQTPLSKFNFFFLNLGLQLQKNYEILEFKPFWTILKTMQWTSYSFATRSRKRKYQNQKRNTKLRNNATFGKSIENPLNKIDVKTVTTRKQSLK